MTIPRDQMTPGERWALTPRPFEFVRVRMDRDEIDWLLEHLRDIKSDSFEDVEQLRKAGKSEDDPELQAAVRDANYSVKVIRQADRAYIDMLGPRAERP